MRLAAALTIIALTSSSTMAQVAVAQDAEAQDAEAQDAVAQDAEAQGRAQVTEAAPELHVRAPIAIFLTGAFAMSGFGINYGLLAVTGCDTAPAMPCDSLNRQTLGTFTATVLGAALTVAGLAWLIARVRRHRARQTTGLSFDPTSLLLRF